MSASVQISSPVLKPFIKHYLIIDSPDGMLNRILPDTSLVMVFRYKGNVTYFENEAENLLAPFGISGLRKSSRLINYSKGAGNILVIFKEMGVRAFLNEPLNELFGLSLSLDHFISRERLSQIEERLAEAKDNIQRIAVIEEFLLSVLNYREPDKLISAATQKIHFSGGTSRIKELAETLCISQDAFEKRFRRVVGTSPKQFSSIVKMRMLIRHGLQKTNFTDLAYQAGYFDQAHFNKDFKRFTGQTPTDFFKRPVFW